mgnify:CR=1 FL=1
MKIFTHERFFLFKYPLDDTKDQFNKSAENASTALQAEKKTSYMKSNESTQLGDKSDCNDLQLAAWNDDIQTVRRLLCTGADVHSKDSDGWTALHRAAHKGNTEIVKVLLQVNCWFVSFCGLHPKYYF